MLHRSTWARLVVAFLIAVALAVGPRAALCIGDAGHVAIEAVDAACCDAPHAADAAGRCAPHDGEDGDCTDWALTLLAVAPSASQDAAVALEQLPTSGDAVAAWPVVYLDGLASSLTQATLAVRLPTTPRRQHTTVQRC